MQIEPASGGGRGDCPLPRAHCRGSP
jgi:hypothetical protein